jgi:hypothetical protein
VSLGNPKLIFKYLDFLIPRLEFTPTPNPPLKGEGDLSIELLLLNFALDIEDKTKGTGSKSPSPLWGGIEGGGNHMRPISNVIYPSKR